MIHLANSIVIAIWAFEKMPKYGALAAIYLRTGQIEKGMELYEKAISIPINSQRAHARAHMCANLDSLDRFFEYANYEPPHAFFPWFRVTIGNPKITNDPRFKELMDKMNLPMPEGYE